MEAIVMGNGLFNVEIGFLTMSRSMVVRRTGARMKAISSVRILKKAIVVDVGRDLSMSRNGQMASLYNARSVLQHLLGMVYIMLVKRRLINGDLRSFAKHTPGNWQRSGSRFFQPRQIL